MEGVLTDCGSGYGSGHGSGYGYGDGYGYGYGDGSGGGSGHGSGYGDGYGDGDGSGYGEYVGSVSGYKVTLIRPFNMIKVGCQVRTVSEWREKWREIATQKGVQVTEKEVARIEAMLEVSDE